MFQYSKAMHASQGKEELQGKEEEFVACCHLKRLTKAERTKSPKLKGIAEWTRAWSEWRSMTRCDVCVARL